MRAKTPVEVYYRARATQVRGTGRMRIEYIILGYLVGVPLGLWAYNFLRNRGKLP